MFKWLWTIFSLGAPEYCNRTLKGLQLARYRKTFFFSFCVSHFAFSLVTSLGNQFVIRALFTALSTPANIEKQFLSLAFSDLAVGLVSQLMTGIIYAVILKIVSKGDYNLTSLCPTVLNLYYYLFFSLRRIFSNYSLLLHSIDFSPFLSTCDIRSVSPLSV